MIPYLHLAKPVIAEFQREIFKGITAFHTFRPYVCGRCRVFRTCGSPERYLVRQESTKFYYNITSEPIKQRNRDVV